MNDGNIKRDYSVGYGKPPEATRFGRGRSGNPAGKAPGRKNLKTELPEELSQKVVVSENGRRRLMSRQSIIIKRMVTDAARGDAKARDQLLRLIGQIEAAPQLEAVNPVGAAKDAEILARFRAQLIGEIKEAGDE
jgi:Family of unknown function (DUF5681)